MALPSTYTVAPNRIPHLFEKIRDGQAPERLTQTLLKDWGLDSSNDRALIPILKSVGFLTDDGKPTQRYHDYRDHSRSKKVLGQALRENYSEVFLIKSVPTDADRASIVGKFKSSHNVSSHLANLMGRTFLGLLSLADVSNGPPPLNGKSEDSDSEKEHDKHGGENGKGGPADIRRPPIISPGLHYNIQIHLPPTKDIEVYNAIFKSLKEHLFDT